MHVTRFLAAPAENRKDVSTRNKIQSRVTKAGSRKAEKVAARVGRRYVGVCCERKREKDRGRGEVPGRGSMRCSLTDLWISLLSARGWLRRLTRAASQAAGMEEGEKGGRQRMGGGGRGEEGDVSGGFAEGGGCLNLNLPPVCIL